MDFNNSVPIYEQIKDYIKRLIINKNYSPGEKLPSTREFAVKLKVNPNTMSRVYKELEIDGTVFTKRGLGTFVTEDKSIVQSMKHRLISSLLEELILKLKDLNLSETEIREVLNKKLLEVKNEEVSS